jgi:MATE family multidrug resistance protein
VLAEVSLFTAAAFLMGWLGTNEVAAHAIALQCASTAFMVPLGVGMAATVRVGIAYGRNDPAGVGRAGWIGLITGTGFMAFTALLFLTNGSLFVGLFLDRADPGNAEALRLAGTFLVVAGIFQLADGAQVVAAHALRGLSDTAVPMLVALVGYWAVGDAHGLLHGVCPGLGRRRHLDRACNGPCRRGHRPVHTLRHA